MIIAIFGGSFNPPHLGHYEIVSRILKIGKAQKCLILPSAKNPLKDEPPSVPSGLRLEMLKKTFLGLEGAQLCDYELKAGGTSFTVDTLEYLSQKYTGHRLSLVLGSDAFAHFSKWLKPGRILELAEIWVCPRQGQQQPDSERQKEEDCRIRWIDLELPDISSSRIRSADLKDVERNQWMHPEAFRLWKDYVQSKEET